jgi:site-specific DNA recombinase
LPPNCIQKGINARIADAMLWKQVVSIMSSPQLLLKKIEWWFENQKKNVVVSTINIPEVANEITKLKEQEDRYVKAYGAGVITVDKLREHTAPIKEKILSFENQINKAQLEISETGGLVVPKLDEVEAFSQKILRVLDKNNLSFNAKKGIIMNIIDKVVGTREQLQVYGFIPITSDINVFTVNRNCWVTKCREINPL